MAVFLFCGLFGFFPPLDILLRYNCVRHPHFNTSVLFCPSNLFSQASLNFSRIHNIDFVPVKGHNQLYSVLTTN